MPSAQAPPAIQALLTKGAITEQHSQLRGHARPIQILLRNTRILFEFPLAAYRSITQSKPALLLAALIFCGELLKHLPFEPRSSALFKQTGIIPVAIWNAFLVSFLRPQRRDEVEDDHNNNVPVAGRPSLPTPRALPPPRETNTPMQCPIAIVVVVWFLTFIGAALYVLGPMTESLDIEAKIKHCNDSFTVLEFLVIVGLVAGTQVILFWIVTLGMFVFIILSDIFLDTGAPDLFIEKDESAAVW